MEEHQPSTHEPNTSWPAMETRGRLTDQCKEYLSSRGLDWALAEANGWYPSTDASDGWLRIVIPAVVREKNHAYWQARAVAPTVLRRYQSPKGPRLDAIIRVNPLRLCESVLGEDGFCNAPEVQPIALITEGPMDSLAGAMSGYISFAIMGLTPPTSTIDFLAKSLNGRPSLICLDNEAEANKFAFKLCLDLASRGIRSRVVANMPEKDLAKMSPDKRGAFLAYHAKGLTDGQVAKGSKQTVRGSRGKTK